MILHTGGSALGEISTKVAGTTAYKAGEAGTSDIAQLLRRLAVAKGTGTAQDIQNQTGNENQ